MMEAAVPEGSQMNRESYDRIAQQWDAARTGFVLREREYLEALLGADDGGPRLVLDLGCGSGRPIAEYVLGRGHRVVGVDQSEELLKLAAARYPDATWLHGPIEDGAWLGEYDAVVLWDSLFHIDRSHHRRILGWIAGSLRPGGRVMLTVGGSSHPAFTDTMFDQPFYYDSLPPDDVVEILTSLDLIPVISEFMNQPTGGRDKGRYAVVAEKAGGRPDPASPGGT